MRTFVNSVTHWDIFFLNKIFHLDGKRLVTVAVPWLSHSGDGYYYPVLPVLIYFVNPEIALPFFLSALFAFAIELPLYKLVKSYVKRDRPCETNLAVYKRISPSDRFSFPSGHTAAAVVIATLISYFFPLCTLPAFAWAILVGFSRIFLGVHYPTDVLAGLVIGLLCGLGGLACVV